jgi:hypothetical protein
LNFFFEIYAAHGHLKGYKLECGKDMMRPAWRGSNVAKRENRTFNTETEVINLCIAVEALDEIQIALDDFREHFDYNYNAYYCTWLTEMLNNVRWGAQDYVRQESELSLKRSDGSYPKLVDHPIARQWYNRLITKVRAKPNFARFVGSSIFKSELFPNGVT